MKSNPFKAVVDIRREELPLALCMFGYFFLVITSFWILKPIKKSLFIQFYDTSGFDLLAWSFSAPQAELLAKVLNMVVAFAAVVVFTALSSRFRRQQLTFIFSAFFIAAYAAYSGIVNAPSDVTVWSFYLFGDLYSTLMVATFFAFLNDSVTPDAAKRLYGLVGLGGVTGGVFGTTVVSAFIKSVDRSEWLWICTGVAVGIVVLAWAAGRIVDANPPEAREPEPEQVSLPASEDNVNPAIAGAQLVFRSPYLLSIVAIVGLYEIVSTVMDFQFSATIAHYLDGPAIGEQFARVFAITNMVSMFVQLFLTSWVMRRFGLGAALMVLPVTTLVGSLGFMAAPVLVMGSALNTVDNAFSYSINQSAKETLYVPTTTEEKYRAKAFIDMFVQRFAKAIAVGVSLVITQVFQDFESIRWLSLFTAVTIALWMVAALYAGRRFNAMTADDAGS